MLHHAVSGRVQVNDLDDGLLPGLFCSLQSVLHLGSLRVHLVVLSLLDAANNRCSEAAKRSSQDCSRIMILLLMKHEHESKVTRIDLTIPFPDFRAVSPQRIGTNLDADSSKTTMRLSFLRAAHCIDLESLVLHGSQA